tara:strand:- start:2234 stop:2413 length:180 start_codon:yes stop_codon:yes gene_type:complete
MVLLILILKVSVAAKEEVRPEAVVEDPQDKMASNMGMVSCRRISIGHHQMEGWNFQHPR